MVFVLHPPAPQIRTKEDLRFLGASSTEERAGADRQRCICRYGLACGVICSPVGLAPATFSERIANANLEVRGWHRCTKRRIEPAILDLRLVVSFGDSLPLSRRLARYPAAALDQLVQCARGTAHKLLIHRAKTKWSRRDSNPRAIANLQRFSRSNHPTSAVLEPDLAHVGQTSKRVF
jgi:hypothetical protein